MSAGLFDAVDAYDDDPVNPKQDRPTPIEIVADLPWEERATRVQHLEHQAKMILAESFHVHAGPRQQTAVCVLISGGNDSTTVAHLFRRVATHLVHVNTGTGIPETTQFVRDTAEAWGLPLIEVTPDDSYRDLVLGRVKTKRTGEDVWPGGFPGPGAHGTMYQRLKERALDKARHQLGIANSRTEFATWIAGRRRQESERRTHIPRYEADGSVVWASPVVNWTALDLSAYRRLHGVPQNPVTHHLHMSGECLCGSFAKPNELDEIGFFYPTVAAGIRKLQDEVREAGFAEPFCRWGHGEGGSPKRTAGRLCSSCDALWEATP